jgi:hypothetical protein
MEIGVGVLIALVVMFFAWAMVKGIGDEDEY